MSLPIDCPTVPVRDAPASQDGPVPVDGGRLLIVGNGMASHGLCAALAQDGVADSVDISVYGEEPTPAYDRVNLSQLFSGKDEQDLQLADRDWYRSNRIKLKTDCRIVAIDRIAREIVDAGGSRYPYDQLVLATGSRARLPPIPGVDSPGVFVYRTVEDLKQIKDFVGQSGGRCGAVIGGGLLGLEAAKILFDLGLETTVVEMAPGLMPRQLDADAAKFLKRQVESIGVDVHLVRRTKSIAVDRQNRLQISFTNARPLTVDVLIVAAGVSANDSLARECDLPIGPRGGIVVDQYLQTSDPNIFAIGECACFRDHVFGLVAPCFRMADVLANRLAGRFDEFLGADESAELKLLGVNVAVLGQAIGESPAETTITQRDDHAYRKLIVDRGRVVGAACVGPWDELPHIRQAVHDGARLWPWNRARFRRTGSPWAPGGVTPVEHWPARSIVCSCREITKGEICQLVDQGVKHPDQLAQISGASTACGSCRPLVDQLAGEGATTAPTTATRLLLVASLAAVCMVLLLLVVSPIDFTTSVQSPWHRFDRLWRSDFGRQVTGYTLLGLLLLGQLFSLRKRTNWFRWRSYATWRSIHGILGAAVLIAVAVHTGLRLGNNLNFVLSTTFIATAAVGAVVGICSGLESRLRGAWAMRVRRWRPLLMKVHLWLFWPVPLLIAFHVFTFYWFDD